MDKILKAADDIAAVFNVTQEWLEPGRSEVVKILKQLVEEKLTSANSGSAKLCRSCIKMYACIRAGEDVMECKEFTWTAA